MSQLYDAVHGALAKGATTTEEIVAECGRSGLQCRPETVRLFLQLSRELVERDGVWSRRQGTKQQKILRAMDRAFETGQAYVNVAGLANYLNGGELVTADDIGEVCEESGTYRLQGRLILRNV
jgi:hypothetical protein